MVGIKIYPDFTLPTHASRSDRELLEAFLAAKKMTQAQYVNFAVYNYGGNNLEAKYYLTYPLEWITHYVKNSFLEIDPLLSIDYRRVSFVDWRDLWRTKEEMRVFTALHEFGIGDNGLSLVSHLGHQVFGALSLIYNRRFENWGTYRDKNMEMLRLQCEHVCNCYLQNISKVGQNRFKLTKREIECLYWVAIGKTDAQIALLLGVGRWTVVGHIKSTKFKLETPNRPSAVARAISSGLLDLRTPL